MKRSMVIIVLVISTMLIVLLAGCGSGSNKLISTADHVSITIETTEENMRRNGTDLFEEQERQEEYFEDLGIPKDRVRVIITLTDRPTEIQTESP